MARVRSNNTYGQLDDPLSNVAEVLNSAGLVNLDAVEAGDHAVITLDPGRVHGAPEIVYVTAHAASATTATIERGKHGTAARSHPASTRWDHAPVAEAAGDGGDYDVGEVAYTQMADSQPGIGQTVVDVTGLSLTVTIPEGHVVRVLASLAVASTATGGEQLRVLIADGANGLHQRRDVRASNAGAVGVECVLREVAAGGAKTYKVQARAEGTAGTFSVISAAGLRSFLQVEDLGPER